MRFSRYPWQMTQIKVANHTNKNTCNVSDIVLTSNILHLSWINDEFSKYHTSPYDPLFSKVAKNRRFGFVATIPHIIGLSIYTLEHIVIHLSCQGVASERGVFILKSISWHEDCTSDCCLVGRVNLSPLRKLRKRRTQMVALVYTI